VLLVSVSVNTALNSGVRSVIFCGLVKPSVCNDDGASGRLLYISSD